MIRFHKDEKPTTGTRMPTQAVISVVNAAISQFNIKVNVAEWSPIQNLLLYFTGDSTNSQITKAQAMIMGVLARGCLRSTFLECVKWSRIVVHDVTTQDWDTSSSEFVDVDAKSMEAALRTSHPILTDATFMEGPDWTARDGPKVGSTNTNISFAILDHDESRLKAITKSPLVMFGSYCQATLWTEKINLIRCPRCWKYGSVAHPDCPIRCKRCRGNHPESSHNKECLKCVKSDINQEDRAMGLTTCTHPTFCPNCREDHLADNTNCRMRNFAACEERHRRKVGRGQRFITSYTDRVAPPTTPSPIVGTPMEEQQHNDHIMFGQGQPSTLLNFN